MHEIKYGAQSAKTSNIKRRRAQTYDKETNEHKVRVYVYLMLHLMLLRTCYLL